MPKPGSFARASMMALCLSAHTHAMAAADTDPIHVVCDDVRLTIFCDELATALSEAQNRHEVAVVGAADQSPDAHLTIRFETVRLTASILSGHLSWRDSSGVSGAGPTVDLTVMDATIREPMLRDFARQILSLTDLPL